MSNFIESNFMKQQSSPYPISSVPPTGAQFTQADAFLYSNGASYVVGDGVNNTFATAPRDILAVCRIQGSPKNLHYFSTSFSGGPEWRF